MHRAYHPQPDRHAPHRRFRWWTLGPWLLAGYLATGLYSVQTSEQAVVRRCGQVLPQVRTPGLHFGFPWGIDRVDKLKVLESKEVQVNAAPAESALGRAIDPRQAECLTGDRNLIRVTAVVQYRIVDPKAYLFQVADLPAREGGSPSQGVSTLVEIVTAAALTSVVAGMKVDDVFDGAQRALIQSQVLRATQAALDRYGAGVQLQSVSLPANGIAPPKEVEQAFGDVIAARQDRQRAVNEAQAYADSLLPSARGEAQRVRLESEGYAAEVREKAQGDAQRFLAMLGQLAATRDLTIRRLILETMEEVLPRLKKVVVDARNGRLDLGLLEEQ